MNQLMNLAWWAFGTQCIICTFPQLRSHFGLLRFLLYHRLIVECVIAGKLCPLSSVVCSQCLSQGVASSLKYFGPSIISVDFCEAQSRLSQSVVSIKRLPTSTKWLPWLHGSENEGYFFNRLFCSRKLSLGEYPFVAASSNFHFLII